MREQKPVIQTMKASEARQQFSSVIGRVFRGQERVIVERSGIPVAAIISAKDLERLDEYDRRRDADFAIVNVFREAFKDVPPEEIEREAVKSVAEARAELRAEREKTLVKTR